MNRLGLHDLEHRRTTIGLCVSFLISQLFFWMGSEDGVLRPKAEDEEKKEEVLCPGTARESGRDDEVCAKKERVLAMMATPREQR